MSTGVSGWAGWRSVALLLLLAFGCSHAISGAVRDSVDRSLSLESVFRSPDTYQGRVVMLGGEIVTVQNVKEGGVVEVLEKPLDGLGRPRDSDASLGRFLVVSQDFLDPSLYAAGRRVTVAGEIVGSKSGLIGEMEYRFPVVRAMELHLVRESEGMPVFFGISIGVGGSF